MDEPCLKTDDGADIPGYTGYRATKNGEIVDTRTGRVKQQRPAGNGAMQVHIGKSTRMVHDLVARAFHGRPPGRGYRVKHRDGDLSNNKADNLVWGGTLRQPDGTQEPTISLELEREYEQAHAEHLALIELMQ